MFSENDSHIYLCWGRWLEQESNIGWRSVSSTHRIQIYCNNRYDSLHNSSHRPHGCTEKSANSPRGFHMYHKHHSCLFNQVHYLTNMNTGQPTQTRCSGKGRKFSAFVCVCELQRSQFESVFKSQRRGFWSCIDCIDVQPYICILHELLLFIKSILKSAFKKTAGLQSLAFQDMQKRSYNSSLAFYISKTTA